MNFYDLSTRWNLKGFNNGQAHWNSDNVPQWIEWKEKVRQCFHPSKTWDQSFRSMISVIYLLICVELTCGLGSTLYKQFPLEPSSFYLLKYKVIKVETVHDCGVACSVNSTHCSGFFYENVNKKCRYLNVRIHISFGGIPPTTNVFLVWSSNHWWIQGWWCSSVLQTSRTGTSLHRYLTQVKKKLFRLQI